MTSGATSCTVSISLSRHTIGHSSLVRTVEPCPRRLPVPPDWLRALPRGPPDHGREHCRWSNVCSTHGPRTIDARAPSEPARRPRGAAAHCGWRVRSWVLGALRWAYAVTFVHARRPVRIWHLDHARRLERARGEGSSCYAPGRASVAAGHRRTG